MTRLFMQDPVQVIMQNKIDHLRQRVAELEASAKYWKELSNSQTLEIERRKHWEKDAERYQWLVKHRWVTWAPIGQAFDRGASGVELDAAIDAAMEADK